MRWGTTLKGFMATPNGVLYTAEATPAVLSTGVMVFSDTTGQTASVGVRGQMGSIKAYRYDGASWKVMRMRLPRPVRSLAPHEARRIRTSTRPTDWRDFPHGGDVARRGPRRRDDPGLSSRSGIMAFLGTTIKPEPDLARSELRDRDRLRADPADHAMPYQSAANFASCKLPEETATAGTPR